MIGRAINTLPSAAQAAPRACLETYRREIIGDDFCSRIRPKRSPLLAVAAQSVAGRPLPMALVPNADLLAQMLARVDNLYIELRRLNARAPSAGLGATATQREIAGRRGRAATAATATGPRARAAAPSRRCPLYGAMATTRPKTLSNVVHPFTCPWLLPIWNRYSSVSPRRTSSFRSTRCV